MEFMKTGLSDSEKWKLQQRNDLEVGELEQLPVEVHAGRLAIRKALCGALDRRPRAVGHGTGLWQGLTSTSTANLSRVRRGASRRTTAARAPGRPSGSARRRSAPGASVSDTGETSRHGAKQKTLPIMPTT